MLEATVRFDTWTPVSTNNYLIPGLWSVSDPRASIYPMRFYRI